MRIVTLPGSSLIEITAHASLGFALAPIARGDEVQIVCVRLSPGGRIGRHPAVGRQILAVLDGEATVSGYDGVEHALTGGSAAIWEPGENHETRTGSGLTALVIEGDLELLAAE